MNLSHARPISWDPITFVMIRIILVCNMAPYHLIHSSLKRPSRDTSYSELTVTESQQPIRSVGCNLDSLQIEWERGERVMSFSTPRFKVCALRFATQAPFTQSKLHYKPKSPRDWIGDTGFHQKMDWSPCPSKRFLHHLLSIGKDLDATGYLKQPGNC